MTENKTNTLPFLVDYLYYTGIRSSSVINDMV